MGTIRISARIENVEISEAEAKMTAIKTKLNQLPNILIEEIEFSHTEA